MIWADHIPKSVFRHSGTLWLPSRFSARICFCWGLGSRKSFQTFITTQRYIIGLPLEHLFHTCESVTDLFDGLSLVLNNYLERPVLYKDIVHFSFNHRNKKKLNCALWFAVKVLYRIYQNKSRNKAQVLREVVKDIDWNLRMNWNSGFRGELLMLKEVIENIHQSGDGDD